MRKDNFEFWCELNQVEKAVDEKTGEEIMLLGGIASTADEDSNGEFLDPPRDSIFSRCLKAVWLIGIIRLRQILVQS